MMVSIAVITMLFACVVGVYLREFKSTLDCHAVRIKQLEEFQDRVESELKSAPTTPPNSVV